MIFTAGVCGMRDYFGFCCFELFREIRDTMDSKLDCKKLKVSFGRSGVLFCCQLVELGWIQSNRIFDLEDGLIHR